MTEPNETSFRPAEDASLARASAEKLYQSGWLMVNPLRWTRLKELVRFEDVVAMFVPGRSQVISCPFHGQDSKPSFHLYRRTNDAFCFGCPPGKGYYDHVRFIRAQHSCQPMQALRWLEREFKLPKLADVNSDRYAADNEEGFVTLTFADLKDPFIRFAARDIAARGQDNLDFAKEYAGILFAAWPSYTEEKVDPNAGDALALARVLGSKIIDDILTRKAAKRL